MSAHWVFEDGAPFQPISKNGFELHKGWSVVFWRVHCYAETIGGCWKETVWPWGSRQGGDSHKNISTSLSDTCLTISGHLIWPEESDLRLVYSFLPWTHQIMKYLKRFFFPLIAWVSLQMWSAIGFLEDSFNVSTVSHHQRLLTLTAWCLANIIPRREPHLSVSLPLCLGTSTVLSIMVSMSVAQKCGIITNNDRFLDEAKIQETEKLYFYSTSEILVETSLKNEDEKMNNMRTWDLLLYAIKRIR